MNRKPSYDDLVRNIEELQLKITTYQNSLASLHENEKKYKTILENMEESYYEVDLKGNFTFFNDALCRSMGYPPEELLGMNYKEYETPETAEKALQVFREVLRTGKSRSLVDYEIIKKSGELIISEVSVSLKRDTKGNPVGFYGVARDVTEKRRAEEALRDSEEQYRTILENMQEGYYEVDLAGNLIFFNDAVPRLLGYTREELMESNYKKFSSPETHSRIFNTFHEVYSTGNPKRLIDYEVFAKDGSRKSIEVSVSLKRTSSGNTEGFRCVARDVTERVAAEDALRQSEHRYRSFVENSFMGFFISEIPSGVLVQVNRKFSSIFGYETDEMQGRPIFDFIHYLDHKTMRKRAQMKIDGRLPEQAPYVYNAVKKDGSIIRVNLTSSMVPYEGVNVIQGMVMDYSEMERLERQLIHAQKMEAVGTLASGIAHDFNNLLTGILGNISLVLAEMPHEDNQRTRLQNIEQYIKRGTDLTRQLLSFAQGGLYEVRATDLKDFVQKSSEMFGRAKKEVRIIRSFPEALWSVEVDEGQLEQVLLNLYVNAWHAMPGGGELLISAENCLITKEQGGPHKVPHGRYVKLSVRDSGCGMDQKTKARIFEPFFTTREQGKGSGLGLASVYGIIRNHGGFITVESTVGVGTTFEVFLPASKRKAEPAQSGPSQIQKGIETILLVDDEDLVLDVASGMLENLGYRVLKASGGDEALDIFRSRQQEIELVILDMIMPGKSGMETFENLVEMCPNARVLLSSGYSLNGLAKDIMDKGCLGFIQKPFGINELSSKIREVLDAHD